MLLRFENCKFLTYMKFYKRYIYIDQSNICLKNDFEVLTLGNNTIIE